MVQDYWEGTMGSFIQGLVEQEKEITIRSPEDKAAQKARIDQKLGILGQQFNEKHAQRVNQGPQFQQPPQQFSPTQQFQPQQQFRPQQQFAQAPQSPQAQQVNNFGYNTNALRGGYAPRAKQGLLA